jgi:hypothetical protein
MAFLTEDIIVNNISEYINDSRLRYAILLDGEWGCGKTYFTKKILMPFLENLEREKRENDKEYSPKKVIYISLYGVSSSDDIMKQIWLQTIQFKENMLIKKIKPYSDKTTALAKTVFMGGLSYFNVTLPKVDFEKLIDLDKCILFFDDLERCNMSINEVLGYINNYVEHNAVKTIIIANEKEIGKLNITANLEFKYLLALQEKIDFPDKQKKKESSSFQDTSNQETFVNIDKIASRIEYLFSENFIYNQIKEKLIGITICYKPEIIRMLDMLAKDYIIDDFLREAIISSKEFIKDNFEKYNHTNLRTLLFSFEKYKKIGEVIKNCNLDDQFKSRVLKEVYRYCLILSIKVKQGEKIPEWSEESEYGERHLSTDIWSLDYLFGFKFADEVIINSNFDAQRIENIIYRYFNNTSKHANDINDPLNILMQQWWELEDGMVINYVSQINKKLQDNNYNTSLYPRIITLYLIFQKIGLGVKLEEVLSFMKNNICELEEEDVEFDTFGIYVDEDIREDFSSTINELREYAKVKIEKNNIMTINSCFDYVNEWAERFYQYIYENKNRFLRENKFFCTISIDKIFECIKQSSNSEIIKFRQAIQQVYNFSNLKDYFISDYDNIKNFSEKVNDLYTKEKNRGVIKAYNLKLLLKQLESYLSKLSND